MHPNWHLPNPHLVNLGVLPDEPGELAQTPAPSLVSPRRFDLAFKHVYAHARVNHCRSAYPEGLYVRHLYWMTGFTCVEGDGSKSGSLAFLREFNALIESMQRDGWKGAIPVDSALTPIDGSHRAVAALALGITPTVLTFSHKAPAYNAALFRGMAGAELDRAAVEYCRLSPTARLIVLFPAAAGVSLDAYGLSVIHSKAITLPTREAQANLITELYLGESWCVGNGDIGKATPCFLGGNIAVVALVDAPQEAVIKAKQEIRAKAGVGHDSVHATDTQQETLRVARCLFHDQSVRALDRPRRTLPRFEALRVGYLKALGATDPDLVCADGSAALAVHGLREPADWDFVHAVATNAGNDIHSHNLWAERYPFHQHELIFNPGYYFWSRGVKYASPGAMREIKALLAKTEAKSADDLKLLDRL